MVYEEQKNGKLRFTNITGDASEHVIDSPATFWIDPSQMAAADHVDFDIQNIRLISAEISRAPRASDKIQSLPFDASYKSEVNLPGNKVIAAIDSTGASLLTEAKIDLPAGSIVWTDFVCNSESLTGGKISLGVRVNLGSSHSTELKGDWTRYKSGSFETTGTGTLKIATANSMPQSDITIRDGGALEFTGNLDYTTGAGTILDLRGCSKVSGDKSLTIGAGGKLIF